MKVQLRKLVGFIDRLSGWSALVAELGLVVLLLLVFHEVVVRYLLDRPTLYSVEVSEYLLIIVAFMAAGWVLREDKHVAMTSVVMLTPKPVQRLCGLVTSFLVLGFCIILVWQGADASWVAYRGDYHSSSLLSVPMWIPYAVIPIGALVLTLQMVARILRLLFFEDELVESAE